MRTRMSELELAKVEYTIYEGDFAQHATLKYWQDKWSKLLASLGSREQLHDEEFLMQDRVTTLSLNGEMIGIHLIKDYTAKDFHSHPYFAQYDDTFIRHLESKGVKRAQSLQYFMIDEKFSVQATMVNFGAILASLSLRHQHEYGNDVSVTLARADIPVTTLGLKIGFEVISEREMHNVPVTMLACFGPRPYPKGDVERWTEFYWNKRRVQSIQPQRKAA